MAQGDLTTPPPLRIAASKPKMTIYYALLIIAFVAMLAACLILYLEIRRFQREAKGASLDRPAHTQLAESVGRTILSVA